MSQLWTNYSSLVQLTRIIEAPGELMFLSWTILHLVSQCTGFIIIFHIPQAETLFRSYTACYGVKTKWKTRCHKTNTYSLSKLSDIWYLIHLIYCSCSNTLQLSAGQVTLSLRETKALLACEYISAMVLIFAWWYIIQFNSDLGFCVSARCGFWHKGPR